MNINTTSKYNNVFVNRITSKNHRIRISDQTVSCKHVRKTVKVNLDLHCKASYNKAVDRDFIIYIKNTAFNIPQCYQVTI